MRYLEILKSRFGTQESIAKKLGVSQPTVQYWIAGKFSPSVKNAIKIEQATGGLVTRAEILPDIFGDAA